MRKQDDTAAFERYKQEHGRCLGVVVRQMRTERGLTPEQLAKRAEVSVSWLQKLETHQLHTNYSMGRLDRIVQALGVELYDLYKRTDEMLGHRSGWIRKERRAMSKTKRAVLEIREAVGKRVRRLSLAEPFLNSHNIYISIEFDDETQVLIEVESRPYFSITHLARDSRGELEPVKKPIRGTLRALVKSER